MKIIIDGKEFEFETFSFDPIVRRVSAPWGTIELKILGYKFDGIDSTGIEHSHYLEEVFVSYDENGSTDLISFQAVSFNPGLPIEKWD